MNRIFIEKLVLKGKHGVSDRERESEQEFLIDISAEADAETAGTTDNISDTINYKDFADITRKVVEGESFHLVETIAQKIAERILENPKIKTVSVTVRKPQVLPSGVPGVTIIRIRQ
ncbi:dihydroneopterin aldolase [Candidatus Kaiserbacteria bacterium RIFCSPHIGHO2_02_FULL_49_16]|uniref:7,8-dihydroneopterin aldolase n=1 Tax=Candidatus Kaiserbacteria bacterium RIFCSPHIGHO2_02_FULL_49_16 TaxID=1798490 RepID=A0A1F6DHR5_9BACT|nr:MAG: dihydroneopterin aldolase [Candidatus Kaiserbacteria bacterium RIFCSPHIGHO2_02_FULL_49_16]